VPELVDCGGNLHCRPVLGPQLPGGGMFQRATDEGTDRRVPMAQAPVAEPPGSIYRLRVVLAGISPMIWRLRPTKTVEDQLLGRLVILRRRQVRIIRTRTAPGELRRKRMPGRPGTPLHRARAGLRLREQW
jgi:hypothetical protein